MDQIKKRREKYAQLQRKRQREEIMSEKRVWIDPPSPVSEIPSRIENQMWENFQTFLDSFGEKELRLVDAGFKKYLYEELLKHSSPEWNNENAVNILRILFRLQLIEKSHAKIILDLAFEARSVFQASNDLHAGSVLLLLIKEFGIHLLEAQDNENIWEGDIQQLLNQFISTLKIYRSFTSSNDGQFWQIFKNYRIYYFILLLDHRVHLQEFVRLRNVGELYYLIDDCISQTDSIGLNKSMELIKKMLRIQGNEEVVKCLDGVSVLLIEGVMPAKNFLDDEPFHKEQKGRFFTQFLKVMTSTNTMNTNCGVELLALLFNRFDECIPVALQVKLLPSMEDELKMLPFKVTTYADFMELCLSSMNPQTRWNCFWLISNITGSTNYFKQYGLPLLSHIYHMNYLFNQRNHPKITNEITICVLNYLCNITHPEEIQQLLDIKYQGKQIQEGQEKEFIPKPNCLLFCIDVACDIIKMICLNMGNQGNIGEDYIDLVHRAVFSLLTILENAENHLEIVVATLEREKIDVMLELLHSRLTEHYQNAKIFDLITHFLALLSTNIKQL